MQPGNSSRETEPGRADDELQQQINKRLTLNLLIQGAAMHTCLTAHHLVAEELDAIRPDLVPLYDRMAVAFHLNYWIGDIALLYGLSFRFWRQTQCPSHPFHRHRLLAGYGGALALASKRYLIARGRKKRVVAVPVLHYAQLVRLHLEISRAERGHEAALAEAAKRATSMIWGIDEGQLVSELTWQVAFGHIREPRTRVGRITRAAIVGYGGVQREGERFKVMGKAICLPLLTHELTKGTAELICLHGLNDLDDETYEKVTAEADQLEYETWLLQAGPEMWRRLLAVLPTGRPLPEVLTHIARLEPAMLERLMITLLNDPLVARDLVEAICDE